MTVRRPLQRLAALALAAGAAWPAARAQDAVGNPVENGRKLYTQSCARCHGINLATNGIGFDLRKFPEDDKERFVRSVTNGKNAMPAWGATLKPEQMDLIWAYIGSVNGWKSAMPSASAATAPAASAQ